MPSAPITPDSDQIELGTLISQIQGGDIRINASYQRSGQIWPARAKSFLVETVLLRMPIPRILLHVIDPPNPHHSDIIDGQQRCSILSDFRNDGFALTADIETSNNFGKRFSELTPSQQETFRSYLVPIDRYRGISGAQIRNVFRRLNYYTAPLNAAEQRHAQFFGELARFVEGQSAAWGATFQQLRTFTKRQLRRKADQQLMAEVVDGMLNGVSTPTAKSLRRVYGDHDRQFSSTGDFRRRLDRARSQIDSWRSTLGTTRLVRKHYQMFALLMALMHAQDDLASLRSDLGRRMDLLPDERVFSALERLDEAFRKKATTGRYAPFWRASHEKTNVRENRLTRCRYFYRALTGNGRQTTT